MASTFTREDLAAVYELGERLPPLFPADYVHVSVVPDDPQAQRWSVEARRVREGVTIGTVFMREAVFRPMTPAARVDVFFTTLVQARPQP